MSLREMIERLYTYCESLRAPHLPQSYVSLFCIDTNLDIVFS